MNKQIIRKACSGLLIAALVLSAAITPGSASHAATTPKDVKGHWAQKSIEKAIDAGIVAGFKDGSFRPENPVTRAEFSHMINAVLGNTATAALSYKDVKQKDWYYSDVSKAVAAGYASGYKDNTFGPNRSITRQEAAIMLSMVVPTYGSGSSLSSYPDYNKIATWARPAMERMVGRGYINVYTNDKKLHPADKMTRAQAATIIVNLLEKETIVKTQTALNANGSQLSNTIYSNGVTVAQSGTGNAELNKCVVLGTLSVAGGSTVTLTNSRVAQATVQSTSDVTLVAKGETYVKNASVANSASLQTSSLSGDATYGLGFANVSVVKDAFLYLNGTFPRVSLDGSSSDVTLTSGKIDSLVIPAGGASSDFTAESGSTVTLATVGAAAYFHGTGTVSKMAANASGITYEQKPTVITLGSGAKSPTQGADRSTIKTNPANGKVGVSLDGKITITFNTAMKLYNGDSIDNADIEDFVEIRRDIPTGYQLPYSASIDSARKVITIQTDNDLQSETKYYVVIAKNKLKDSSNTANSAFLSSFTTGEAGSSLDTSVSSYVAFTPKNKGTNVSTGVEPELRFTEDMVCYDGTSIKQDDLSDIIIFREKNSSGGRVKFEATLSGDKRTIYIEPDSDLDENTTYYLAIASNSLKTASKGTTVPAASVTWTTNDGSSSSSSSDYISFTPKNNKTGIALDVEPEIRFSEKMVCYDGSTISNSDLDDIIIFREKNSSGDDIDFSATIDSAKKVITVVPEDELDEDTKYYLAIDSKSIATAARETKVAGASVTWTTGDESSEDGYATFYPRDGRKDIDRDEEPTITFSERIEFYGGDSIDSGRSSELEDCITFEDEDGDDVAFEASYNTSSKRITITPRKKLSSDTEYTLSIVRKSLQTRSDKDAIPASSVTWTTE